MTETSDGTDALAERIERIVADAGAEAAAVAFHDRETGAQWAHHGDQWFHAASTIKVPVLIGVFAAIEQGRIGLDDRLHVRNCFASAADGRPYQVDAGRDANEAVQAARGKTMRVRELAHHMIVTSSNLATNVLVDYLGADRIQSALAQIGGEGIEFRRGVDDERAWAADLNNRVTANGLVRLFLALETGEAASRDAAARMLDILHQQEFRSGLPAGLPDQARVAHKTGEISTVAHDAGLVYLPRRAPYALAVLTRWAAERTGGRRECIAALSRAVYEHLSGREDGDG